MSALDQSLALASPRLNPRRMPLIAGLIYFAVFALWIMLFLRGLFLDGIFAWSAGLLYVAYDTFLLSFVAWQTLALRHWEVACEPSGGSQPPPTMGVIIAAYNEAQGLPVTLAALQAQTDPPEAVLIADDGSTDATQAILFELYGLELPPVGAISAPSPVFPALRWLPLPHAGKARALNAALLHLDTDLVLTVDADTLLKQDAVAAMRQAFAHEPALVAATGVLTPVCAPTFSGRFFQFFQTYEYVRNFLSRFAWMRADGLLLISGAFAAFRRSAVLKVGGFDPACLVEDYELIHRLHRWSVEHGLSWQVRVIGAAQATTDAPGTLASFLRQRRRWFAGFLQTQYWNRDMTGNRRFGHLGTMMLPVKAVDMLQPVYGLVALGLLIAAVVTGRITLAAAIFSVIGAKIGIDLAFHLWSLYLYQRWTGDRASTRFSHVVLAAFIEPFSFQILRHLGATLGWIMLLTRQSAWGGQNRAGLVAAGAAAAEAKSQAASRPAP